MKLTILQENLSQALSQVSRVTVSRGQLPILANVVLKTEGGRLKLSATNLEIGINAWVGAKVEKEGEISVPAKVFSELVALLPKEPVSLELEKDQLKVSTSSQKTKILGMGTQDFPKVPSLKKVVKKEGKLVFKPKRLKSIVSRVSFAAAIDETRPILTGVLVEKDKDGFNWVATDGYRLSWLQEAVSSKGSGKWLIPAQALNEVVRLLGDEEIEMAVVSKGAQLVWGLGDVEVVCKLIEGDFPDYQKVVPEEKGTRVEVDKEALLEAVKRAAIFARDSANIVRLEVGADKVKVMANAPEVGENQTQVEAKVGKGEKGEIAFNSRYLLDFLNTITAQRIGLNFSGSLNPGVFGEVGETGFTHIIMPVRVQR